MYMQIPIIQVNSLYSEHRTHRDLESMSRSLARVRNSKSFLFFIETSLIYVIYSIQPLAAMSIPIRYLFIYLSYRPVSLLPVISKVQERCLVTRLVPHVQEVLYTYEHGFQKGKSCVMDSNFSVNNNNSFQTYIQLSLKEWLLVNAFLIKEGFFNFRCKW